MNIVSTYITPDVRYGDLRNDVGGHTVSPEFTTFEKGDVIKFSCSGGWATAVRGWFVFAADNEIFHRVGELPMYFRSGNQWTNEMELIMMYDTDVIVVCEMT